MSKYTDLIDELEAKKCKRCHGLGEWDDSDAFKIGRNTYRCPVCNGDGMIEPDEEGQHENE